MIYVVICGYMMIYVDMLGSAEKAINGRQTPDFNTKPWPVPVRS